MPGFFSAEGLLDILLRIPGAIFIFSLKGFSQAFVAKKLGDPTPESQGRLTMNPKAHIDLIGFIFILIFRFGWTKPVQTNSRYYKKIKRDCAIQILSGPLGLVAGGFVLSFFYVALFTFYLNTNNILLFYLFKIFANATLLSLFLANFYMLPLPGLDGYDLIRNFLPYKYQLKLHKVEQYSMFIFIGFILIISSWSAASAVVYWPANTLLNGFLNLWSVFF